MNLILAAGMVCTAPLLGAYLAGRPLAAYLAFPPMPARAVQPASFSWAVFAGLALFVMAVTVPPVLRLIEVWQRSAAAPRRKADRPFPWWGWAGAGLLAVSWLLAWNRFAWFRPFQAYTFTPLWLGYIVTVNALAWRRAGRCGLTERPLFYAALFPLSAAFWWLFEYLNRYAHNWYYLGVEDFGPWEYFLHASLAFSTVLPAIAATHQWLSTFPLWDRAFGHYRRLRAARTPAFAWTMLTFSVASLIGLGMRPEVFFPFVWVAPLLLLGALQALGRKPHWYAGLAHGDWRMPMRSAAAGLVCGFFWELWNSGSLARWGYTVPYVQRFELFAMPVLGYAGYLPFGMLAMAVVNAVAGREGGRRHGLFAGKTGAVTGGSCVW